MNNNVNVFHDFIENVGGRKISSNGHREQIPVFLSTGFHLVGFGLGPRCSSNFNSTFEEEVYDLCADKACGACDENMTERRAIVLVRACYTCERWDAPRSGERHIMLWPGVDYGTTLSVLSYTRGLDPRRAGRDRVRGFLTSGVTMRFHR